MQIKSNQTKPIERVRVGMSSWMIDGKTGFNSVCSLAHALNPSNHRVNICNLISHTAGLETMQANVFAPVGIANACALTPNVKHLNYILFNQFMTAIMNIAINEESLYVIRRQMLAKMTLAKKKKRKHEKQHILWSCRSNNLSQMVCLFVCSFFMFSSNVHASRVRISRFSHFKHIFTVNIFHCDDDDADRWWWCKRSSTINLILFLP